MDDRLDPSLFRPTHDDVAKVNVFEGVLGSGAFSKCVLGCGASRDAAANAHKQVEKHVREGLPERLNESLGGQGAWTESRAS